MTEEGARQILRDYRVVTGGFIDLREAIDTAIQALEKQIPKKIVNYNKISAAGNCPACMKFIDSCDEYCRYCGQALKEDEE